MAPSDARDAPIDVLGEDDLEGALALSVEAGWNQVAADWRLMLQMGSGFAVRDAGRLVATVLALPYPPAFGWLSMVLVHTPYRRLGLATRLVERATAALTGAGLLPVLDATPAGAEVYARMDFRPVENLLRWRGAGGAGEAASREPGIAERVHDLDRAAFGADRSAVLADLAGRPAPVGALAAGGNGYLLSRAGRTATQLGPIVAEDAATALALLAQGLDAVAGAVVVDVPEGAMAVAEHLEERGFVPERPFVRLALGRDALAGTPELVHAIAGPELG